MTERIDHVVINVAQNLDEAAEQYRRLGFTLTPRGHHSLGTSNHLAVFGTDYLELMGIESRNAGKALLPYPPGLMGLVFKTGDSTALWQHLSGQGILLQGEGPQPLSRPIRLDDGTQSEARFRTIDVDARQVPNGRLFFCHHLTPELVWRPEWQEHPNGALGIAEYAYMTPEPRATARILEKAFGSDALQAGRDQVSFTAGPSRVCCATREALAQRYGIRVDLLPSEPERALALTLNTRSLAQTRRALADGGITDYLEIEGAIVIPPASAMNVLLAFREA